MCAHIFPQYNTLSLKETTMKKIPDINKNDNNNNNTPRTLLLIAHSFVLLSFFVVFSMCCAFESLVR